MAKTLFFVRHAEIDASLKGRYVGRMDVPLSPEGVQQARELRSLVMTGDFPSRVLVSPSLRCRQSWEEMRFSGSPLPQITAEVRTELREVDFGEWEGRNFTEIQRSHPTEVERWAAFDERFRFPGGESLQEFLERMEGLKRYLVDLDEDALLVTHGGVITTLICLFLGLHPSQYLLFRVARASLSTLDLFSNGKAVLTSLNQNTGETRRVGEWPG